MQDRGSGFVRWESLLCSLQHPAFASWTLKVSEKGYNSHGVKDGCQEGKVFYTV